MKSINLHLHFGWNDNGFLHVTFISQYMDIVQYSIQQIPTGID
jgi:hypothetical protein